MITQTLLILGSAGLLIILNLITKAKKEKNELDTLRSEETKVYKDKNSSDLDKELASIRLATEYWKRKTKVCYDFIAVSSLPDSFFKDMEYLKENEFQSNIVFDQENGMIAELIPSKFLNYYLLCLNPEYKAVLREQKLKDLGI